MPIYASDILPDTTGRNVGSADKRYDGWFRNLNFTGGLTGAGLQNWAIANITPNSNAFLVTADNGSGAVRMLMQIRNIQNQPAETQLQAMRVLVGSVNDATGGLVPFSFYAPATNVADRWLMYRGGSATIRALAINKLGNIISYNADLPAEGPDGSNYPYSIIAPNDVNPRFQIAPNGSLIWGAGGNSAPDAGIQRNSAGLLHVSNNAGGYGSLAGLQLQSHAATGTPPLTVDSTTLVPNLNAQYLNSKTWASPGTIGDITPQPGTFTQVTAPVLVSTRATGQAPLQVASQTVVPNLTVGRAENLYVVNSIDHDGSGYKHLRVTTGSIAAGARVIVRITWITPFPSAGYTTTVDIFDSVSPGTVGLTVERKTAQAPEFVDYQVFNGSAGAKTGTLHVVAVRGS